LDNNGKIKKQVNLEDNGLAVRLFGEGGENLRKFEKKLGIELNTRGSLVTVSGAPDKVALAERLILEMYALLRRAIPCTPMTSITRSDDIGHRTFTADVFMDTVYVSFKKGDSPQERGPEEVCRFHKEVRHSFGIGLRAPARHIPPWPWPLPP
jgi:phosphate starvation-inducible PhoH-like protein